MAPIKLSSELVNILDSVLREVPLQNRQQNPRRQPQLPQPVNNNAQSHQ